MMSLDSLIALLPALVSLFTLNKYAVFAFNPFTVIIFSDSVRVCKDFHSPPYSVLEWLAAGRKCTVYFWTEHIPYGDSSHSRVILESLFSVSPMAFLVYQEAQNL